MLRCELNAGYQTPFTYCCVISSRDTFSGTIWAEIVRLNIKKNVDDGADFINILNAQKLSPAVWNKEATLLFFSMRSRS